MFAKLLTLFTVASVAGMGVYGLQHIDDAQPKPPTVSAIPAPPPPPAVMQAPTAPRQVMPPGGSDGSLPANAYFAQYPQWKFWVMPINPAPSNQTGWVDGSGLGMPNGWKYWRAVYLYAYCPTGTGEPNLGTKNGAWQVEGADAGGTTYRLVPPCYDAKVSLP